MQVRLGEAGFLRAIAHPRVWELESWGRVEVAVSAYLVENVGHVKAGNLAVEHRRRKKALSTLSDAGNVVTVERCKCMRPCVQTPGQHTCML